MCRRRERARGRSGLGRRRLAEVRPGRVAGRTRGVRVGARPVCPPRSPRSATAAATTSAPPNGAGLVCASDLGQLLTSTAKTSRPDAVRGNGSPASVLRSRAADHRCSACRTRHHARAGARAPATARTADRAGRSGGANEFANGAGRFPIREFDEGKDHRPVQGQARRAGWDPAEVER